MNPVKVRKFCYLENFETETSILEFFCPTTSRLSSLFLYRLVCQIAKSQ